MDYKQELESLIKMHNLFKKVDDAAYARSIKDFIKTIKWKNFLSTGNYFTEVRLDEYTNTLVVGENGSGKSTMLDALCFALFGRSVA